MRGGDRKAGKFAVLMINEPWAAIVHLGVRFEGDRMAQYWMVGFIGRLCH